MQTAERSLVSVARLFVQFYAGTRKLLQGFRPPPTEQLTNFLLMCDYLKFDVYSQRYTSLKGSLTPKTT